MKVSMDEQPGGGGQERGYYFPGETLCWLPLRLSWWKWWDVIMSPGSGSMSKVEVKGLMARFHWAARRETHGWFHATSTLSLPMPPHECVDQSFIYVCPQLYSNFPHGRQWHGVQEPGIHTLPFSNHGSICIHQISRRTHLGRRSNPWVNHCCQEDAFNDCPNLENILTPMSAYPQGCVFGIRS